MGVLYSRHTLTCSWAYARLAKKKKQVTFQKHTLAHEDQHHQNHFRYIYHLYNRKDKQQFL